LSAWRSPDRPCRGADHVALIKFGALVFTLGPLRQYVIQLRLLGGIRIIRTLLAVIGGLYTRWFHDCALGDCVANTTMAAS
jgi:hypothetical protein